MCSLGRCLAVNVSATTLISSYQDNIKKGYIIISTWENICAAATSCRVMPALQKRRWERSRELTALTWEHISEGERGYLPVPAEIRKAILNSYSL